MEQIIFGILYVASLVCLAINISKFTFGNTEKKIQDLNDLLRDIEERMDKWKKN